MTNLAGMKTSKEFNISRAKDNALRRYADMPEMLERHLDGEKPSYSEIAREMNEKNAGRGLSVRYTSESVRKDIEQAKALLQFRMGDKIEEVGNAALQYLSKLLKEAVDDYERSRHADAKSTASMLMTLMRSGCSFEEAREKIDSMDFARDEKKLLAKLEIVKTILNILGVKGAGVAGGADQTAQQINNYNFGSDADTMARLKAMVGEMQDRRYEQAKAEEQ